VRYGLPPRGSPANADRLHYQRDMPSFQDPPRLFNAYEADPLLREYLFRHLGGGSLAEVEPELRHLGELAVTQLLELQQTDRLSEPRHSPFDAWGRRVDRIELTPLWRCAAQLSARHGLVAVPYERRWGALSRVIQLALLHVIEPSLDVYSCPLAMSDGAARTLLDLGNADLVARAVPRLTSRDPASVWTSGQWMTERTGGSDVGRAETVAREKSIDRDEVLSAMEQAIQRAVRPRAPEPDVKVLAELTRADDCCHGF